MIPLNEMRNYLEKEAANPIGKTVSTFLRKQLLKPVPIILGVVGTGLLATAMANRLHGLYNITSEMRKRRVMKHQIKLLEEIAKKSGTSPKAVTKKQKLMKIPLS